MRRALALVMFGALLAPAAEAAVQPAGQPALPKSSAFDRPAGPPAATVQFDDGTMLSAWQRPRGKRVVGVGIGQDGRTTSPVTLTDGYVVDLVAIDRTVHVVTVSRDERWLRVTTVLMGLIVPDHPTTIGRAGTVMLDALPVGVPLIETHQDVHANGGLCSLVTWWAGPTELRYVALDEAGPVAPVESLTCTVPFDPALIDDAIEETRRR